MGILIGVNLHDNEFLKSITSDMEWINYKTHYPSLKFTERKLPPPKEKKLKKRWFSKKSEAVGDDDIQVKNDKIKVYQFPNDGFKRTAGNFLKTTINEILQEDRLKINDVAIFCYQNYIYKDDIIIPVLNYLQIPHHVVLNGQARGDLSEQEDASSPTMLVQQLKHDRDPTQFDCVKGKHWPVEVYFLPNEIRSQAYNDRMDFLRTVSTERIIFIADEYVLKYSADYMANLKPGKWFDYEKTQPEFITA